MQRVLTFDAAVFFNFQPVGRIFFVFLCRITRHARKPAVLTLGALQCYYDSIAFAFCHLSLLPSRDCKTIYLVVSVFLKWAQIYVK